MVGDFFVGDEFGKVFNVGEFHRHKLLGGFCYVCTGDLGVVCDDG